jgi:signal transduction histidine kinase
MGDVPLNAPRWELAAENIAVKMRWIGVLVGYLSVNLGPADQYTPVLNAILAFGAVFTLADTAFSLRGRVFLGRYPLSVSAMEALFIGVLCHFHGGFDSPFRYYYILSLIVCAIRHSARVTLLTCVLHWISAVGLYISLPVERRDLLALMLTLIVLGWVTWAASAMSLLLKRFGEHLGRLNDALRENQAQLEARIEERTQDLREAQAHVLHQEKMAAFGLLAAGIAHEVGNPLTSISTIVQMLERRDLDSYTRERLTLVDGQLQRIRGTLRELIEFSRPAGTDRVRCFVPAIIDEALGIAKYYKGMKSRHLVLNVPMDLPPLFAFPDQLVQVILNLVLNAIDATAKNGRVEIRAAAERGGVCVEVRDDGAGVQPDQVGRLFQPYFTTKKHGTGLGLFVTRKLVTDHGGEVTFESTPGEGTTLRVWLPAEDSLPLPSTKWGGATTIAHSQRQLELDQSHGQTIINGDRPSSLRGGEGEGLSSRETEAPIP